MDYYDADDIDRDDGAEEGASNLYKTFKDYTVFLIDAQPSMFVKADVKLEGFKGTETWFDIALMTVRFQLKNKVISSPTDQVAVIFYGTREKHNEGGQPFEHVYLWQGLEPPIAKRIRACEEMLQDGKFGNEIGSKTGAAAEHLRYGLWVASQQLQGTPANVNKTVYIFSNNLDPSGGHHSEAAKTAMEQARSRVKELQELRVSVELIPTVPAADADKFRASSFWREVLDLQAAKEAAAEADEEPPSIVSTLQGLGDMIRRKTFKKRPLRSTRITVGPDFGIGVQLFALIKAATKSQHVYVSAEKHELLRSEGAMIDQETGAVVTAVQMRKRVFPKPADPDRHQTAAQAECRFPTVAMTVEELDDLKRMHSEGIHLLGFKPEARLEDFHNLREPTFIYPDEKNLSGSTAAFIALYDSMLEAKAMGIASVVRSARQPPALAALLPTPELYGPGDVQLEPPGIMMITLPWSDDIRAPEAEPNFVGNSHPVADEAAVDAAEAMIQALSLEPTEDDTGYYSGLLPNPALQRHFQVLEALALDEEPPEEIEDQTQPEAWRFEAAASAIKGYKDLVYGEGFDSDITGKKPVKRKAGAAELDDEAKLFRNENWASQEVLKKLTVPKLKVYLKANGLTQTGNKGDLIAKITEHVEKQAKK